jgi:Rho family protein
VPIVLVGLKRDLRVDAEEREQMRLRSMSFVEQQDAEAVARTINAKRYIECSSLTGENVDDVFEAATRAAMVVRDSGDTESSRCCVIT